MGVINEKTIFVGGFLVLGALVIVHFINSGFPEPVLSQQNCLDAWHRHYTDKDEGPGEWLQLESCEPLRERYLNLARTYDKDHCTLPESNITEGPEVND